MTPFHSISENLDGTALLSLRRHLDHPPLSADALRERVQDRRTRLRELAEENPLLDLASVEAVSSGLIRLIRESDGAEPYLRDMVQAAVLFFADGPDADALDSAFGLEAQERAFDAVHRLLHPRSRVTVATATPPA